jgi:hypothetical protein
MEAFEKAVKTLTKTPELTMTGSVVEINLSEFTCDVQPSDGGAVIYDVRLQATIDENENGMIVLPKLNSSVIIAKIGNDDNQWFVVHYTEIDKIIVKSSKFSFEANFTDSGTGVNINIEDKMKINFDKDNLTINASGTITFNGGGNGGLVVANSVSSQLNTVITRVNALQNLVNTFIGLYNAHVPTPATPMTPIVLTPLVSTVQGNFENNKVKH